MYWYEWHGLHAIHAFYNSFMSLLLQNDIKKSGNIIKA
jgi:hypothetical protein